MNEQSLPDTGISGVYEACIGVTDPEYARRYFAEFGFTEVATATTNAAAASRLYGVASALTSVRLRNGETDSHGLIRLLHWERPVGPGLGYAPPLAVGQRMAVMRTHDLFRLIDIYDAAAAAGEPWFATRPVGDDLYGLDEKRKDFFTRPVIVREAGVYGKICNHIFYQRYGYLIPGYGTIGDHSPLRTSELTHHDFVLRGDLSKLNYLETVFGLRAEEPEDRNGYWQRGPREVFQFRPGESHAYRGFVSPNNICGKLKFFGQQPQQPDLSHLQELGRGGITAHSFYVSDLAAVHQRAASHSELTVTDVGDNEFGEASFVVRDSLGCTWLLLEQPDIRRQPVTELAFQLTNN